MKQTQKSTLAERNDSKRQYEQPSIEVFELERQTPLLAASNLGSPNAGEVEEIDL